LVKARNIVRTFATGGQMSEGRGDKRIYKTVPAIIAGLKAGEMRAAAELGDVLHEAIKDEKLATEVLTIIFALLPGKTRRKMLSDPSVPSAKVIDLLSRKPRG
jgi:hypothetical protein